MNLTAIYLLRDPRDKKVKYVGKSVKPEIRFRKHINYAKELKRKTYVYCWIKSLLNIGLLPIMEIIEWTDNWQEREKYWINRYKEIYKLTNLCEGGVGNSGYKHTEEWKKQNAIRMKGKNPPPRKFTEEQRKKVATWSSVPCSKEKALLIKKKTCRTPIAQYDLKGNFIRNWNCPTEAAETLNLNRSAIENCIYGYTKTACKFIWKKLQTNKNKKNEKQ